MKPDKTQIPVTANVRPATHDFIDEAAEKANQSRTGFVRDGIIAHAEKTLGKKAPEVEPFEMGVQNELTREAKRRGISTRVLMRELALASLQASRPAKPEYAPVQMRTAEKQARMKLRAHKLEKKAKKTATKVASKASSKK